jgi:hypothetical protein
MLSPLNWVFGGIGFIILQCAWCCRVNQCGLITAGVFEVLAGLGSIGVGIYCFFLYHEQCEVTDALATGFGQDDLYAGYDDDFAIALGQAFGEAFEEANTICSRSKILWTTLPIVGGGISLLSAILVFVFSCCGGRYEACQEELNAWEAKQRGNQRRAVDIPMGSSDTAPVAVAVLQPASVVSTSNRSKAKRSVPSATERTNLTNDGDGFESSEGEMDHNVDVCFGLSNSKGFKFFLKKVKKTHENLEGVEFSPKVFKSIKRKLQDRDFYVRDRSTASGWRIATTADLKKRFKKHYEALEAAKSENE